MTPFNTCDLSRVLELEARRDAERLYQAVQAARSTLARAEAACPPSHDLRAAQVRYEQTHAALQAAHAALTKARSDFKAAGVVRAQQEDDRTSPEMEAAALALADAEDAYDGTDGPTIVVDDDDAIARCAVSGLPLIEGDDLLVCETTGIQVLRCLVLPGPYPVTAPPAMENA